MESSYVGFDCGVGFVSGCELLDSGNDLSKRTRIVSTLGIVTEVMRIGLIIA